MSLYQKMLVFYAVMAVISFLITWFLTHDKKTNSFPERLFGWRDMADKFPRGIAVFAFSDLKPDKRYRA